MKKHSLAIIWAIIICGTTFLLANKFKTANAPGTEEAFIQNVLNESTIITKEVEEVKTITLENDKSFAEHIKEGDKLFSEFYLKSAISEYSKAVEKNQNSIEALKRLAEAYLKDNQAEKAQENFKKALVLSPNSNEINLGIARSLLNQNKTEEAKLIIWELPSEFIAARYYQGLTLIIYGKYEEGIKIFNDLKSKEQTPKEIKNKCEIFLNANEKINLYAKDDVLYTKLMYHYALVQVEEEKSAIPLLFSLINEKNNYRDAWIILGYSYLSVGKINEAIDSLIKARELDSEKAETMFYLGLSYFANNELEKSVYYLQKAKTLKFRPADLLDLKLAEVYNARNDFEKAEEKYESLIQNGVKDIAIYENIINLNLEKLNNPKKAFQIAEKLYEIYPEEAKTNLLLSKIYLEANKINHAKTYINKALTIDQTNPEIYFQMGKISEIENKQLMAKEYYNTAYIMGYHDEIAKKSADRLNIINASLKNKSYQVNLLQQ